MRLAGYFLPSSPLWDTRLMRDRTRLMRDRVRLRQLLRGTKREPNETISPTSWFSRKSTKQS